MTKKRWFAPGVFNRSGELHHAGNGKERPKAGVALRRLSRNRTPSIHGGHVEESGERTMAEIQAGRV